jgi:hypothetical protein
MNQISSFQNAWWGTKTIMLGHVLQLACADLRVEIRHKTNEWLIQHELNRQNQISEANEQLETNWELKNKQRIASTTLPKEVSVLPALADRAIICRPKVTVTLLPKQQISLFVGLPLWLQLHINNNPVAILDIPTVRISDSWFGPDTRRGVICYATKDDEQLDLTPNSTAHSRATMEIRVINESDEPLSLDKVSIPAPNLGLYVDKKGSLVTRRVTLTREQDENASLTIDDVLSCGLHESEVSLLCKPREDIGKNKITKALSALFG